jgi:hypothetical protein
MTLPDADEIFAHFFDRWYDAGDRERKGVPHTRPDLARRFRPGLKAAELSPFNDETQREILERIQIMLGTATSDWPRYLDVKGEISDAWVDAFDRHHDAKRVAEMLSESDPADYSNDLLVLVCQFGAVIGAVLRQHLPRLEWIPEWPYWESFLYDPWSGHEIPPFHWAIKKFSSYGIDDGFAAKIGMCVNLLEKGDR